MRTQKLAEPTSWRTLGISFPAVIGFNRLWKGKQFTLELLVLDMKLFREGGGHGQFVSGTKTTILYDFWVAMQIISIVLFFFTII